MTPSPTSPIPGLEPVFAVPFYTTVFPNAQGLNGRLEEKLAGWEFHPPKTSRLQPSPVPKPGVYESSFDFFHWEDPDVRELARFCLNRVGFLVQNLNHYENRDMEELRFYHHSWFHLTRPGGYTSHHNHPLASWSGVYCVNPGVPDPADHQSGLLRFFDPRMAASMFLDPGNGSLREPFGFGNLVHRFTAGELVIFPSYLNHEVNCFRGTGIRITIAFNVWIRYADEPAFEPGLRRGISRQSV
jgi:uncharacterized protein (TIGR02466 family)